MLKSIVLSVDFGLVVLIWLVQLIIYPSFAKINPDQFIAWHTVYTRWITVVVAPLMFAQLGLAIYLIAYFSGWTSWIRFALIVGAWLLTFFLAVPLHNALGAEGNKPDLIHRLVLVNWPRTLVWTFTAITTVIGLLFFWNDR